MKEYGGKDSAPTSRFFKKMKGNHTKAKYMRGNHKPVKKMTIKRGKR